MARDKGWRSLIIRKQSSRKNKHEESMADRRAESRGGEEQGEDKAGRQRGQEQGTQARQAVGAGQGCRAIYFWGARPHANKNDQN